MPFVLPHTQLPPTRLDFSYAVTSKPWPASAFTAAIPDEPAPITQVVGRGVIGPPYPKVTPASRLAYPQHRRAERERARAGGEERRVWGDGVERQPQQRRARVAGELEGRHHRGRARAVARHRLDRHRVHARPHE